MRTSPQIWGIRVVDGKTGSKGLKWGNLNYEIYYLVNLSKILGIQMKMLMYLTTSLYHKETFKDETW